MPCLVFNQAAVDADESVCVACVVKANPDYNDPAIMTENGIYEAGCGLDNVLLSWGHDEYLYEVLKGQSSRKHQDPNQRCIHR